MKNCEFCFVSLARQKLLTQFPIEKYLSKERLVVHSLRILKFYCSLIVIANFLKNLSFYLNCKIPAACGCVQRRLDSYLHWPKPLIWHFFNLNKLALNARNATPDTFLKSRPYQAFHLSRRRKSVMQGLTRLSLKVMIYVSKHVV